MHPSDISQDPMQCSIGCLHKNHLEVLGSTHGPEKTENRNIDAMFDYHRVKPMKCNPRKTIINTPTIFSCWESHGNGFVSGWPTIAVPTKNPTLLDAKTLGGAFSMDPANP